MASSGLDRSTGEVLYGWDRIVQSIRTIISTEIGERVQRRDFGSAVHSLQDKPQVDSYIVDIFVAVQTALEPEFRNGAWYGEPCFNLKRIRADLRKPGNPIIYLYGVEIPDGHLGIAQQGIERTISIQMG